MDSSLIRATTGSQAETSASTNLASGLGLQTPRIPAIARELSDDVLQLHSSSYRRPDQIPAGRVLLVGGSNTG